MQYPKLTCAVALGLAIAVAGCGGESIDRGPTGTLSGKVTFQGQPLAEGTVSLTKAEGGAGATGAINEDGTYEVQTIEGGVPVGTYQVSIIPPEVEKSMGPNSPPTMAPKEMPNLPKKYHSPRTSGLTVDIQEGENTKDFDLQP